MKDERIKATLYGRNHWAFYKIGEMEGLGRDDSAILEHLMTRLLTVDQELVREHKVSVTEYQAAGAPAQKPATTKRSGREKPQSAD